MRLRLAALVGLSVAVTAAALPARAMAQAAQTPSTRAITFAESPGAALDYIFPFMTLAFYNVQNVQQFQYLMFRPLYWFGSTHSIALDPRLSLAREPIFSDHDRAVTVTLKPYRWSNGERVIPEGAALVNRALLEEELDFSLSGPAST